MPWTRITARWSGWAGGPGYSRMRFDTELTPTDTADAADDWMGIFRAIYTGTTAYLPTGVSVACTGTAEVYDDSGVLSNVFSYTPPTGVTGATSTGYSGASGAVITWHTGLYHDGREVRGRTFLVPLTGCFENNGTLSSAALTAIQAAATAFAGSPHVPGIVSGEGNPDVTHVFASITGATVPDMAAVLRSRRQ